MFDLHSGLGYSIVDFFSFPFLFLFSFLFVFLQSFTINDRQLDNLQLADCKKKKCIANFGVVQRQLGELPESSAFGAELGQEP